MRPLKLKSSAGDEQSRNLSAPPAPRVILASVDAPISPNSNAQAAARAFFLPHFPRIRQRRRHEIARIHAS